MEVEAECDRQNLCQKIIAHVDLQVQNHLNSSISLSEQAISPAAGKKDRDNKTPQEKGKRSLNTSTSEQQTVTSGTMKVGGLSINLDNIQICTYVCDFGNVVVGGSKKRSFRLTNCGKMPINFVFDKKLLGQAGIAID